MLNMRHRSKNGFRVIFSGIPQHQKGYLIYVSSTQKIVFSHDIVFGESFSNALAYISRKYSVAFALRPEVLYIPYDTSSHEKTGNIIPFAHFVEWNLVETKRCAEEYESKLPSIDELSTEDEYDDGSISTNALEDIRYGSQIKSYINARDGRLKVWDHIKQMENERKGEEMSENSMGKGLHKVSKTVVNELKNAYTTSGESGSEVSQLIPEPRNFSEVTSLLEYFKNDWLKATLKEIKI